LTYIAINTIYIQDGMTVMVYSIPSKMQKALASLERDHRSAFKTEVLKFVAVKVFRGGGCM